MSVHSKVIQLDLLHTYTANFLSNLQSFHLLPNSWLKSSLQLLVKSKLPRTQTSKDSTVWPRQEAHWHPLPSALLFQVCILKTDPSLSPTQLRSCCSINKSFRSHLTQLWTFFFSQSHCFLMSVYVHEAFTPLRSGFLSHRSRKLRNTPVTQSIFRTLAFNLYYFRNLISPCIAAWLTRKPRSSGLGDLGVLILEESAEAMSALRTFQALLSAYTTKSFAPGHALSTPSG